MILDRLNAFMFAHPTCRGAQAHGPSTPLLISRSPFVSLQISKIEPICVPAWAALTIIAGLSRQTPSMPVVMSRLVSAMGGYLHVRL